MPTIALVPLDDRPVTRILPVRVGALGGYEVRTPPVELLGNLTKGADVDQVGAWLAAELPKSQAVVLALDTLTYGGLIPSRQGAEPLEVLRTRLAPLRRLLARHPGVPVFAFAVSTRLSAHAAPEEEKPYWEEHGAAIFRYSYHLDRYGELGEAQDREAAETAHRQLPREVLADYLRLRNRNAEVLRDAVAWAAEGAFEVLVITSDDSGTYGLNVAERRDLGTRLEALPTGRVLLHPGADEVASVLVARAIAHLAGRRPTFQVRWSTPTGPQRTAMYEDRPLAETLAGQVRAVGGCLVDADEDGLRPDVELFVNTFATAQGDLALGIDLDEVDRPPRELAPFVAALREALAEGKTVALADVAFANGADPALMDLLAASDLFGLSAYGAWNTAGNTLGSVVAAATAGWLGGEVPGARHRYLVERLADDHVYQTLVRPWVYSQFAAGRTADQIGPELDTRFRAAWAAAYPGVEAPFAPVHLPWDRPFEVEATLP